MSDTAPRPALRPGCGCLVPVIVIVVVGIVGGLIVALSAGRHASGSVFRTTMYNDLTQRFGSAVSSVDCPDDLPTRAGSTFDCTVHFGAERLIVHVQVARRDGKAVAEYTTDQTVVDIPATANLIREDVVRRTGTQDVAVDCGPNPLRLEFPGGTFACRLTIGGSSQQVTVTVGRPGAPIDYEPRPRPAA